MSFFEYRRPRRVDGGLKARSARGAIGQSWWARRFVEVLESFALGTRLTRGRSYARAGQVLSLTVAPGTVTAAVQGSRPKPYRVSVGLPLFGEPVWARVEVLLAAQALFSARLLAGDLPPELERVFAEAGATLFPAGVDELAMRCDCPDFAVPCKHLAATFYLLAEALDADPFQLLHWRGRDREELLTRLRQLRGGGDTDPPADPAADRSGQHDRSGQPGSDETGGGSGGAGLALADLPAHPLAEVADRFWVSPVGASDRALTLVTDPDLLLRQLGPAPAAIGGPGLTERLRRAYQRFGADPG